MTHEMLRECGLVVDQCYTITWREAKYTLIHVSGQNRTRVTNIQKVMNRLQVEHGIIFSSICGFETITSNAKDEAGQLEAHPGFKQMVVDLNTKRDTLEWWMENGDLDNNRKGLLWKHIEDTDAKNMTKSQLVKRAREWSQLTKENNELKTFNTVLTGQVHTLERELTQATDSRDEFRKKAKETFDKYNAMSEECDRLKAEITRLRCAGAGM